MTKSLRPQSASLYENLCIHIPGGVNSPVRACKDIGITPLVAKSGFGDILVDADDNQYIDYCGSWGALIHGHANKEIVEAAIDQVKKGSSFGATTEYELRMAKKVQELVPGCKQVRFVSSGTEATMSALRLARGFTKRSYLVTFSGGYHGHADYFLIKAGSGVTSLPDSSSAGIPEEVVKYTLNLPYNDISAFSALMKLMGDAIACVIIEPIAANMGVVPASKEFLEALRDLTKKHGALLIFDEVISGFRVAKGGASFVYGIDPDLFCFAKILGGGFPAACFGGKKSLMDFLAPMGPVYQAGTLSGNPVAMCAGLKALELLDAPGFYETLERKTNIITKPLQKLFIEKNIPASVQQVGSLFTIFLGIKTATNWQEVAQCDKEWFTKLFLYLFENGVYIPPSQFETWAVSFAHTEEHLEKTRDLLMEFFMGQKL